MFCSNCGKSVKDEDIFCAGCGTRIEREAVSEATADETVDASEGAVDVAEGAVAVDAMCDSASGASEGADMSSDEEAVTSAEAEVVAEDASTESAGSDEAAEEDVGDAPAEAEVSDDGDVSSDEISSDEVIDGDVADDEGDSESSGVESAIEPDVYEASEDVSAADDTSAELPADTEVAVTEDTAEDVTEDVTEDVVDTVSADDHTEYVVNTDNYAVDVKPKKKKLAPIHKRGTGAHIGATLLSLLLAVFLIATLALTIVRTAIAPEAISGMISNIDLDKIEIDEDGKKDLEELGLKVEDDNVLDIVYDNIDQDALADPLTEEEFEAIVKNEEFAEYFGTYFGTTLDSLINGEPIKITSDDIVKFITEKSEAIEEVVGYPITEERVNNLKENLDNNYADVFKELEEVELSTFVGKTGARIIDILFADWLYILLIVFDALLMLLVFLTVNSFRLGLKYCGIVATAIGVVFLAGGLFVQFGGLGLFMSGLLADVITQVIKVVIWNLIIITVSLAVAGALMLVISYIIKKYLIKHRS